MRKNVLQTQPVAKLLVTLGLPMMVGMLINSLYNIIDSIYVARLGTDAVTALSIIFPLQNLTVAVSVGLGVGVNSVVARYMGAGEPSNANKAASVGMLLALFHAVLFLLIGLFLVPHYVGLYSERGSQVFAWGCDYGRIVLCFAAPYLIYLVLEKLFQSLGWMKTTMALMILGAVTNIILDPIMIFGWLWIPPMGVSGAAAATVIGQLLSCLGYIAVYFLAKFPVRVIPRDMRPDRECIKSIYTVALPSAVTLVLPSVLVACLNGILAGVSPISIAVLGIYYKIQTFFYMPCSGLMQGMRPLVSFNYGAGEYRRVRQATYYGVLISAALLLAGLLLLELFPNAIISLFDPAPELRTQSVSAFRVIALGFVPSAISLVANAIFEALGEGADSLAVSLLRQFILMVPAAWILGGLFGPDGVWAAFPVSELSSAAVAALLLRSVFRKLGIVK